MQPTQQASRRSANARQVPHVATYRRELPVSLERLYENALDWEHLPWLHSSSFCDIECQEAGDWGWRALAGLTAADPRREIVIELRLDRGCRRWITTTLEGPGAGTEIWTHAFSVAPLRTDIVVDFFVPDVPPELAEQTGAGMISLYTRLYDEDVWMMSERQGQLERPRARPAPEDPLDLGPLDELRARLPVRVEFGGRGFRIVEHEGRLLAHATVCPHLLGPLGDTRVRDGAIQCPWHGYRFDVASGANLSGQRCRLAPAPEVRVDPDTSSVTLLPGGSVHTA